ncbi:hypothetical protein SEA_DELAGARZA_65 [Microbacterium phage DelaGarza]|nr:hypothetical protein SEA_DELAGARZA_65 [Microbacterium phage DelaGarza]
MASTLTLPVLIFAGGLGEARAYAEENRLGRHWVFVRDPDQARYLPARAVAILPGFERNTRYELLAPLAEVLEHEHGPHVPLTATTKG